MRRRNCSAFYSTLFIIFILSASVWGQTKRLEAEKKYSEITYKLTHPLHEIEAVSRDVSCWLDIDVNKRVIQKAFVQVPVSTFNSGNSNRDSHAMEVIDAITYPDVRFTSTSIAPKGDSLMITGKLTFHGITKMVNIAAAENWQKNKLTITGNFDISLTAFKIERPSLMMIPVKDDLLFSFEQVFNIQQ
ncbi:MAG: YceI family protein [Syntrophothermus sp.]